MWKDIPGFEGYYQASTDGEIRSYDRKVWNGSGYYFKKSTILKPARHRDGHLIVCLSIEGKSISRRLHRLILLTFIGPCPDGMEVCHNNGIPNDNRLDNLRYDTPKNNNADMKKHGTSNQGENSSNAKLTNEKVLLIRKLNREGLNFKILSEKFNVSPSTIRTVCKRLAWAHVQE